MRITATLSCEWGGYRRSLFFQRGRVRFAALEHADGKLPLLLFRHKVLSREQYETVKPNLLPDRSVGQNLIEMGLITPQELRRVLREEVYQVFLACMKAKDGRFLLREDFLPKGIGNLPLVFPRDLFRALLGFEDKVWLSRRFGGSLDFVPEIVRGKAFDFKAPAIPDFAGKIYRLIDGKRDFRRLSFEVDVDDFVLLKFLYAMLFLGIIRTMAHDEVGEDTTRSDLGEVWSRLRDLVDEAEKSKTKDDSGALVWPLPEDSLESWSHGERRMVVRGGKPGESPNKTNPAGSAPEPRPSPVSAGNGGSGKAMAEPEGSLSSNPLEVEAGSLHFEEAEADFFSHLIEEQGLPPLDVTDEEVAAEPDLDLDLEEPTLPEPTDAKPPRAQQAAATPPLGQAEPPRRLGPLREAEPPPVETEPPPPAARKRRVGKALVASLSVLAIAAAGWLAYTRLAPGGGRRSPSPQKASPPQARESAPPKVVAEREVKGAGTGVAERGDAETLRPLAENLTADGGTLPEPESGASISSAPAAADEVPHALGTDRSLPSEFVDRSNVWAWMDQGEHAHAAAVWKARLWDDSQRYTLGLFLACDPANVAQTYRAVGRNENLFILPRTFRDKPCFWVCWGLFASPDAAMASVGTLPAEFLEELSPIHAYPLFKLSPQ